MLMIQMVRSMLRNEKGQGMVEYGLILALIAVVAMGAMGALGTGVATQLNDVRTAL